MKRREFVKSAVLGVSGSVAAASWRRSAFSQQTDHDLPVDADVKRVLILFKCHLDVGFTDTQANVMRKYFKQYFPLAIETASRLRQQGSNRYVWTTGSWLLYEYFDQADAEERRLMEQAVVAGDIAWHALPFSWQTETLDRSMIEGCLAFSSVLDSRFGRKTIAGKMTDVPCHSRGIISPLSRGGLRLLDIGVNPASTPPDVPDVFLWKNPDGSSIAVLYHRHDYGSTLRVPGSDLAVSVNVRSDNSGPHTLEEITSIYAELRRRFPNALLTAGTLTDVALAMEPTRSSLPVVSEEIGDTWIYGVPSDPPKMARYRELARLRHAWIDNRKLVAGDAVDRQLLRRLALVAEHTWGTDTKKYIDHDHYTPKDLAEQINSASYQIMERSWQEKRNNIQAGVANLPAPLQAEAEARLKSLEVRKPDHSAMHALRFGEVIQTQHFKLLLDPRNGSIQTLVSRRSGRDWASESHPLALFTYQTLTQQDYIEFLNNYVVSKESWAPQDFGKPNIERFHPQSREWHPTLKSLWTSEDEQQHRILAELSIEDPESERHGLVAWPQSMYLELALPKATPIVHLTYYTLGKSPNRMPESMWLTFMPLAGNTDQLSGDPAWSLEKVDQEISATDVVRDGGRHMHAVTSLLTCIHASARLGIKTLDAPVIALGGRSPLNFSKNLPDLGQGAHVNLFNNAWGTNYPQWAGGDWKYRFTLTEGKI